MPHVARRVLLLSFALSAALAACRHVRSSQPAPEPAKTFVHVTNGEFLDAVVYVVDRGQNVRLGVASSNRTTSFEIPPHLVFAPRPLSFLIHPIGGTSRPSTGDVVIEPGDDIELRLSGGRVVVTKRPQ
jgi:hypothetical protein